MKYALDELNIALIKKFETDNQIEYPVGTPIAVYTEVPNDAKFPILLIDPSSMAEANVDRDSIGQSHTVNIEVISKYKQGAGGWGINNSIMDQVLQLIRVKNDYLDLTADGLKVIRQSSQATQTIRDAYVDGVYFRTILIMEFEIEEI